MDLAFDDVWLPYAYVKSVAFSPSPAPHAPTVKARLLTPLSGVPAQLRLKKSLLVFLKTGTD